MTPTELTLSILLWFCAGCLAGYRYHVLEARDEAVDRMLARVAVRCIERPTDARVN